MYPLLVMEGINFEVTEPQVKTILQGVSLRVEAGISVAIVGPSGAGKTTLASIMGGLLKPTGGSYEFKNEELSGLSVKQMQRFRSLHLGFVFQDPSLVDERSVVSNVAVSLVNSPETKRKKSARIEKVLDEVNISHLSHRRARELSGGERQRVAIARALVKDPDLLIADEPTASLDQVTGQAILDLLATATSRGTTLVTVSHDQRAAAMADQTVTIVDGRML